MKRITKSDVEKQQRRLGDFREADQMLEQISEEICAAGFSMSPGLVGCLAATIFQSRATGRERERLENLAAAMASRAVADVLKRRLP